MLPDAECVGVGEGVIVADCDDDTVGDAGSEPERLPDAECVGVGEGVIVADCDDDTGDADSDDVPREVADSVEEFVLLPA